MIIRSVEKADAAEWLRTRTALWPGDHASEIDEFFAPVARRCWPRYWSPSDRRPLSADSRSAFAGMRKDRAVGYEEVSRIVCFRRPL